MKKRIGSLLLVVAMCLTLLPTAAFAVDDEETATAPEKFVIKTVEDLQTFADAVNSGNYDDKTNAVVTLDADLDLAGIAWIPMGDTYHGFAGTFDGQGHTISNLTIGTADAPITGELAGLFGVVEGTVKNLFLDEVSVNANVGYYVGGLAAYAVGPIENCHITKLDMDAAASGVGGLIGYATSGNSIYGCSVSGEIAVKSGCQGVGGFIGSMGKNAQITYSGATVAVTAPKERSTNAGGFIGRGNGERDARAIVKNCYSKGAVTGGAYAGGFTGSMAGMDIQNCYATGNVTDAFVGMTSFAGTNSVASYLDGVARNCYATGTATAGTAAFLNETATARSEVVNCYYVDTNTAVATDYEKATAKSLEEMKTADFAATLNDNNPDNGWIYKDGQTPLCGAEPADYSAVYAALPKIPADLTVYTDETVAALNTARANVVKGKVIAKQSEVDAWATAIEDAVVALEYKSADYTKVDAALAKVPSDVNGYTDASVAALNAAIAAVDRTKNITEQTAVDAMATAIENAIAGLTRKSSGSSGSSTPRYEVTAPGQTAGGTVSVSPKNAAKGSTVTITVTPAEGYEVGSVTAKDAKGNTIAVTDKGNGKYTFIMPGSKVSIGTAFTKTPETSPFDDVSVDAYYFDAVKWAADKGITGGVSDNLFAPDDGCTRAHIVTFLWRAAGSPEPKSMAGFTDVSASAYYAKAVAWAVENGVTNGTTATTFDPDAVCTRAQAVAFLARALNGKGGSAAAFTDVPADSYYADAVAWAVANSVTNGVSSDRFAPNNRCTRAQITAFLYRAYVK